MGGLAALSAMGVGGEVRAIGLHEKRARGNLAGGGLGIVCVFEGDDTRKRDGVACGGEFFGLLGSSREAVKDCAEAASEGGESGEGIVPAVALVNDHVEVEACGEVELLLKKDGLSVLVVGIGEEGLLSSWCDASRGEGGVGESFELLAREMVVIETALAEGDHFGVAGEFLQSIAGGVFFSIHLVGVNPDGGKNLGVGIGEGKSSATGLQICTDGNEAGDSCLCGSLQDRIAICIEIRKIQMTVGVDEQGKTTLIQMGRGESGFAGGMGEIFCFSAQTSRGK